MAVLLWLPMLYYIVAGCRWYRHESCCWWCFGSGSVAQQSVEVLEVLFLLDDIVDVESQQEDMSSI